MKILLVEPDRILQKTYSKALESADNKVVCSSGAQEALNALNVEIPDMIIMELELPKNSGIELLYELRSYGDLDKIKIVILSTISEKEMLKNFGDFKSQFKLYKHLYKPTTTIKKIIELTQ